AFMALWESFTATEKKFIMGLSKNKYTEKPFAAEFLSFCGITTASSAQRSARSLKTKDITIYLRTKSNKATDDNLK
ncbi:MAG: hypothetical protein HQK54_06545, partial [Oligoflexales bacterium]|nr:hypothetical protein [Oligoflexales bacterium]